MRKNKTILIIGAKSDIALAVAKKFASKGYNIQLAARDSSELEVIVSDLKIRYKINVSKYELNILKYHTFGNFINSLDCLPDITLSSKEATLSTRNTLRNTPFQYAQGGMIVDPNETNSHEVTGFFPSV